MSSLYLASVAVAIVAIPAYLLRLSVFSLPTNVFELLVVALVATGFLIPAVRRQWRTAERLLPRPVIVLVGLFVLAALISAVISDVPRVSFGILKSWIIIPLLLAWIVYGWRGEGWKIEKALILSGVIVSILSLAQFQWGERLAGIYDVPNSLALYLTPLVILVAARRCWVPAIIMFLTLLLTQSTAGLIAVLLVLGWLMKNIRWRAGVIAIAAVALASSAYPLLTSQSSSVAVRLQLWDISWELIKEHPLLGVGLGQFEPAYQQKLHERITNYKLQITNPAVNSPPLREFVFRDPHNWVLSFWLNTGLLGLLSFLGINLYALLITRYSLPPTALALLALFLFGLVDTIYWKNDLAALHWVLFALLIKIASGSRGAVN